MSFNDNELENNISEEAVENTAEEIVEEIAEEIVEEISEEITEEIADEVSSEVEEEADFDAVDADADESTEEVKDEADDTAESISYDQDAVDAETETKKKSNGALIALIVILAAIIIAVVVAAVKMNSGNPYNKLGYINPSNNTIDDVAKSLNMPLSEFLEQYGLPADMPADTTEAAAFYSMPFKNIASMYGTDVETMKSTMNIPDETTVSEPKTFIEKIKAIFKPEKPVPINEDTPWGLVFDEITLGAYVGEEAVESFKEYYDLPEEVNADTKYKEVRKAIDEKTLEMMAEQEAANAEQEGAADENTDEEAEAEDAQANETEEAEENSQDAE